jgi:ribosomal protein L35
MYVRSHIENVSGINKYIYIDTEDDTNKKYIREKNIYYPVKKYKGVLKRVKNGKDSKIKRGGAGKNIKLIAHIYNGDTTDKDKDKLKSEIIQTGDIDIDRDKIVEEYYRIFGKTDNIGGVNHFIIIKEDGDNYKEYIRKLPDQTQSPQLLQHPNVEELIADNLKGFYHIMYRRNNKITKHSLEGSDKEFLVIFSISKNTGAKIAFNTDTYKKSSSKAISKDLYDTLIQRLGNLFP